MRQHLTEPDRVSVKVLLRFGVIFLLVLVASMGLMHILIQALSSRHERRPASMPRSRWTSPSAPNIPTDKELMSSREAELLRLRSYGWVDADSGIVHVPISEAMDAFKRKRRP